MAGKTSLTRSLWLKTPLAMIWGLALAMSIMLNLHYMLPMAIDTRLLVGLLVGFTLWAGIMTYFYSQETIQKASLHCGIALLLSAGINLAIVML